MLRRLFMWVWWQCPISWRSEATLGHMGWLVSFDPRLHTVEVPTITVEQVIEAVQRAERLAPDARRVAGS